MRCGSHEIEAILTRKKRSARVKALLGASKPSGSTPVSWSLKRAEYRICDLLKSKGKKRQSSHSLRPLIWQEFWIYCKLVIEIGGFGDSVLTLHCETCLSLGYVPRFSCAKTWEIILEYLWNALAERKYWTASSRFLRIVSRGSSRDAGAQKLKGKKPFRLFYPL